MWRVRDERGQTAAEYLGVLAAISVIVAVLVASPIGPELHARAEAVICRILTPPGEGADCAVDPIAVTPPGQPADPCVRSSTGGTATIGVSVLFVDLGDGTGFVLEEMSDGKYKVSWANENLAGVTGALVEGKGTVRIGDQTYGAEGEISAEAALVATLGDTRSFDSEEAALSYIQDRWLDEGIKRMPAGRFIGAGRSIFDWITGHEREEGTPEDTSGEIGLRAEGTAGGTLGPASGELTAAAEGAVKVTNNEEDGSRTVALALSREGSVGLGIPVLAELGAAAGATYGIEFTVDAQGNVTKIKVSAEVLAALEGGQEFDSGNLDGVLRQLTTNVGVESSDRTVIEYEVAVSPELNDAALDFLARVPRAGVDAVTGDSAALEDAAGDLWDRLGPASTVTLREYSDTEGGAGLAAKLRVLDIGGGIEGDVTMTTSELVSAYYLNTATGRFVPDTACTGE